MRQTRGLYDAEGVMSKEKRGPPILIWEAEAPADRNPEESNMRRLSLVTGGLIASATTSYAPIIIEGLTQGSIECFGDVCRDPWLCSAKWVGANIFEHFVDFAQP